MKYSDETPRFHVVGKLRYETGICCVLTMLLCHKGCMMQEFELCIDVEWTIPFAPRIDESQTKVNLDKTSPSIYRNYHKQHRY